MRPICVEVCAHWFEVLGCRAPGTGDGDKLGWVRPAKLDGTCTNVSIGQVSHTHNSSLTVLLPRAGDGCLYWTSETLTWNISVCIAENPQTMISHLDEHRPPPAQRLRHGSVHLLSRALHGLDALLYLPDTRCCQGAISARTSDNQCCQEALPARTAAQQQTMTTAQSLEMGIVLWDLLSLWQHLVAGEFTEGDGLVGGDHVGHRVVQQPRAIQVVGVLQ